MTLAEVVQLTDGQVAFLILILVLLLGVVVLCCVAVVLGCVWAYRAGRGSSRARHGWIVVGSFEVVALLLPIAGRFGGGFDFLMLGPLAAQGALFLLGRSRPRPPQTQ